jgi:hypothetical protein
VIKLLFYRCDACERDYQDELALSAVKVNGNVIGHICHACKNAWIQQVFKKEE